MSPLMEPDAAEACVLGAAAVVAVLLLLPQAAITNAPKLAAAPLPASLRKRFRSTSSRTRRSTRPAGPPLSESCWVMARTSVGGSRLLSRLPTALYAAAASPDHRDLTHRGGAALARAVSIASPGSLYSVK